MRHGPQLSTDLGNEPAASAAVPVIDLASCDAIYATQLNGIVTAWNQGAETLYGYLSAEMVGQQSALLYPRSEVAAVRDALEKVRRRRESSVLEALHWRVDGDLVEVEVRYSPILDRSGSVVGASSVARDIGERNRRIRESERTQVLPVRGQVASWRTRPGVVSVMTWSPEMYRITGVEQGTVVRNRDFFELVHAEDRPRLDEVLRRVLRTGLHAELELRITRPDGAPRWLFMAANARGEAEGSAFWVIGVARDVTTRKEAKLVSGVCRNS